MTKTRSTRGNESVISALRVLSVHFEIVPAVETDIVLQLPEDS